MGCLCMDVVSAPITTAQIIVRHCELWKLVVYHPFDDPRDTMCNLQRPMRKTGVYDRCIQRQHNVGKSGGR